MQYIKIFLNDLYPSMCIDKDASKFIIDLYKPIISKYRKIKNKPSKQWHKLTEQILPKELARNATNNVYRTFAKNGENLIAKITIKGSHEFDLFINAIISYLVEELIYIVGKYVKKYNPVEGIIFAKHILHVVSKDNDFAMLIPNTMISMAMNVSTLKERAKFEGISGYSKLNKKELIKLLKSKV